MRVELDVPDYSPEHGVRTEWEGVFEIFVYVEEGGATVIKANQAGLITLAKHLLTLAQAPLVSHIHYDSSNSLEEGSSELIIAKA